MPIEALTRSGSEQSVTSQNLTAEAVIDLLDLRPLEGEGGLYRETYRLAAADGSPSATAIYYLLTPDTFSEMHRLPHDELYHFYRGDPVDLLLLGPDGSSINWTLGTDIVSGMTVQALVPGGYWQGSGLRDGGSFALMGTTMTPGFRFEDYERGERAVLQATYPGRAAEIAALTRT